MENPILRNGRIFRPQPQPPRYPVSHSPSFGGVPIYPFDPTRETHQTCLPLNRPPERNSGPKVVQIPVHFVGSEQVDRQGSALEIQKVFRGYLVRKCLKKIKDIKVQVDEIRDKLSKREVLEAVRKDEKERLRMSESLMSLLFKLDSICGVDFGVRGCRKAVIREAIALQEKIDSIVNDKTVDDEEGGNGQIVSVETDSSNQISGDAIMEVERNDGEVDIVDVGVDREVKVINCAGDDGDEVIHEDCDLAVKERSKQRKAKEGDDSNTNREMLERMMEDNTKMMSLMTQLCERNETQTRMINALTQRVEMLEKAFLCDNRLRKKKKNKKAAAAC